METGSLRTAPTASHPAQALSLQSRSAKWRGVGQRWCEAELHRSKGELLSRFSDAPQAQFWFQRSFLTARRQHAKLGELRAACSLARLWRDQGKANEAGDLLRPIYAWFTEGFDTPDLKEAKALLDALHE